MPVPKYIQPREWQLQEAKSRLSEVVRQAQSAPQLITLRGDPSAVVLSFSEYRTLLRPKASLPDVMRTAPEGFADLDLTRSDDTQLRDVLL
jgi:prevent-host-death family protein